MPCADNLKCASTSTLPLPLGRAVPCFKPSPLEPPTAVSRAPSNTSVRSTASTRAPVRLPRSLRYLPLCILHAFVGLCSGTEATAGSEGDS